VVRAGNHRATQSLRDRFTVCPNCEHGFFSFAKHSIARVTAPTLAPEDLSRQAERPEAPPDAIQARVNAMGLNDKPNTTR